MSYKIPLASLFACILLYVHFSSAGAQQSTPTVDVEVAEVMDKMVASDPEEVRVIKLQHSHARELSEVILQVFNNEPIRITVDERTNSLIVVAPPQPYRQIEALIQALDTEQPRATTVELTREADTPPPITREATSNLPTAASSEPLTRQQYEAYRQAEQKALRLAMQYPRAQAEASTGNPQQAQKLRDELHDLISEAFDARQQFQQAQIEHMRKRLEAAERRLKERQKQREAVVTQRLAQMLSPEPATRPIAPPSPRGESTPPAAAPTAPAAAPPTFHSGESSALPRASRNPLASSGLTKSASELQNNLLEARRQLEQAEKDLKDVMVNSSRARERLAQAKAPGTAISDDEMQKAEAELARATSYVGPAESSLLQAQQRLKFAQRELEAAKRLLELDVQAAESYLNQLQAELQKSQEINNRSRGSISPYELDRLGYQVQEAETQVERARTLLELYKQITDES